MLINFRSSAVDKFSQYRRSAISLGCSVSRLLTRHNQGIAQWSPDPFPRKRVGSGHETTLICDVHIICSTLCNYVKFETGLKFILLSELKIATCTAQLRVDISM